MKKSFTEDNPEDFVLSWKNEMDKNKGNKKMDDYRIQTINASLASNIPELNVGRIAVIIEYEFYQQALGKLLEMGYFISNS